MPEKSPPPTALTVIEKYTAAIMDRAPDIMQGLRTEDYQLDWVHSDAFEDQPLSRDQVEQFWPAWFQGFSQVDYQVTRTLAAETVLMVQWTFSGTHDGPLGPPIFNPPLAPTGKTIRLRGVSVYDLCGGKAGVGTMQPASTHQDPTLRISRETMYIDLATLYVELGVKP